MLSLVLLGFAALSAMYWAWALICVVAFGRRRVTLAEFCPPVTVLKPLCGGERYLYDNLRSFCEQRYPTYQVIFGVRDPDDPAVAVVNRLIGEFPELDLSLVISDEVIGANLKVSNLANLYERAKYDVLVFADSDVHVGPDYLRAVVAPLAGEQVGIVTCPYKGVARDSVWSTLGAMFINEWFFPSVLVAVSLQRLRYAFGATIACRRETLEEIGGFEALADYLADDCMLGWSVTGRGYRAVLSSYVVENVVVERGFKALFLHELRWARTFRTASPLGYLFSVVTYGIPISLLALAWSFSGAGIIALVSHLSLRAAGHLLVHRVFGSRIQWSTLWLIPVRDTLSFALWALSFLGRSVRWRGQRFLVLAGGRLHPLTEPAPVATGQVGRSHGTDSMVRQSRRGEPMTDAAGAYLRTLFLHPPSFAGFDGGAGSRFQARREVRSFWYPTWLAQPAALVPGSRLVDAPPDGLTLTDILPLARQYELAILHTSTPSFAHDVKVAEALKAENPGLRIGFVGAHVAVAPEEALRASEAIEFVARNEFDFTIQEVARGRPLQTIRGLSYRENAGIRHTPDRPVLENMDALPFVVEIYKRDLTIENYFIGYLLHPYVSFYTGRGCRSRCTFCLWPQTVGGRRYRTRSVEHVVEEVRLAARYFPQIKEYFFDDDTFTGDLARAEALARHLGRLGVTWSCNARADVPSETLRILKDNGLRLLVVGYESGNQQILNRVKKGIRLDVARRFTKQAKELGIKIHGTFILGLPGETRETIQETIRFACELDPDTIQVSIAAPYPGTALYREAVEHGWLDGRGLVDRQGVQVSALSYPHLSHTEIFESVEAFYRRFYFRPRKIFTIAGAMARDRQLLKRRLSEGIEFLRFLSKRRDG